MNKLSYILLIILVITSCQTADNDNQINDSLPDVSFEFKNFSGSSIGIEKDGVIELKVSEESILSNFKEFIKQNKLDLKPEYFKIITIENNNYLRFHNIDNSVSTIELIKDENNIYKTGSTVCTSTSCASGGGCVPSGVYCTKCQPYGPDSPITGDCERTTTGSNEQ